MASERCIFELLQYERALSETICQHSLLLDGKIVRRRWRFGRGARRRYRRSAGASIETAVQSHNPSASTLFLPCRLLFFTAYLPNRSPQSLIPSTQSVIPGVHVSLSGSAVVVQVGGTGETPVQVSKHLKRLIRSQSHIISRCKKRKF